MKRNQSQVNVHYVASTTFTIDKGYSDLKPIGRGSYGVVCSAFSTKLNRKVAIKKITPISKHTMDAKHVLREIMLMRHMGKHENIITLEDLILRENNDELYIVMELLDSDLHRVLQSKQILTESHYKYFLFQLLCGVKYLHDNKIIHRDLKPGNLLVSKDCKLRITDFGLARERPDNIEDGPMTEHVVTRWYRAPELMLCPDGLYSFPVDVWSCGCILAEMLGRNPLFPGKTFIHQLSLCFDVIGTPHQDDVTHIVNSEALEFLQSQNNKRKVAFSTLYPTAESAAWRMLDSLLVFNPDKRCTIDEALQAPYLRGVGQPISLVFPPTSPDFAFPFENPDITRYQLKQLIAAEITSFRREKFPSSGTSKQHTSTASKDSVHLVKDPTEPPRTKLAHNVNVDEATSLHHSGPIRTRAPAKHEDQSSRAESQYKEDKSQVDENVPSYLKGTRNFKTRSASAPRGRAAPDGNKVKTSTLQREDKHADDDASVHSNRRHSTNHKASSLRDGSVGIAGMPNLAPNGASSPITAHNRYARQDNDAKHAPVEVTSSTMRHLLDMCDELYKDPAESLHTTNNHKNQAQRKSLSVAAESKQEEHLHSSRARPITHYQGIDADADCKTIDRHESLRDSKEWSAALYHTTHSSNASAAQGQRSPQRSMRVSRQHYDSEDKPSYQLEMHYRTDDRSGGWESKLAESTDSYEPRQVPTKTEQTTAAEDKLRLSQMHVSEAPARPIPSSSSGQKYLTGGAGSDTDDEDVLTPVPRSPPRKSILETYTSPKRLGNRTEADPYSPGKGFVQRSSVAETDSSASPVKDRRGSLVDKLQDRANRLAAAYQESAPAPQAAPVPFPQTFARPSAATRQVSSDVDEDSSVGTGAPRVYPYDEEEEVPAAVDDRYPAHAQLVSGARLHATAPTGGIAAREREPRMANDRERDRDRDAPPIIPPPPDKKKFTVAKSPKFALMSWQKRLNEQKEAEEKEKQRLEEEAAAKKKTKKASAAGASANANYFGYQAPKRSDSAPRRR